MVDDVSQCCKPDVSILDVWPCGIAVCWHNIIKYFVFQIIDPFPLERVCCNGASYLHI